ncbi:MAG TPA: SsrA-binding protein SmpB [Bacteroidales bacterium]|nr:SsrA-binding protein SmpB [Bacteroidales bacterium]
MMQNRINIKNKRAYFDYEILEKYTAGLILTGTEIKSVRTGKVSLGDSFCYIKEGEVFVKNMNIAEYKFASHYNHDPNRDKKLLLEKQEIRKLLRKTRETGLTLIALRLFISDRGYAKLDIALAKGKKLYDKRESIKQKDNKRQLDRMQKHH